MKTSPATIVTTVIAYFLLAIAALVEFDAFPVKLMAAVENPSWRESSDLGQDELSLASDMKELRRDLHRGGGGATIAKERGFVRQDLLNIEIDRMAPAVESQHLLEEQDLATFFGEWLEQPLSELTGNS